MQRLQVQNHLTSPTNLQPHGYLGHPVRIQFSNRSLVEYVYAADGRKLREKHTTAVEGLHLSMGQAVNLNPSQILSVDSMDYADNIRYRKQHLNNIGNVYNYWYHFDDGYLAIMPFQQAPTAYTYLPTFHYQVRDHQGNVRVVASLSSQPNAIEQKNEYFPYGGPWGDASTNQGFQPYKYNGKELDRVHGLDWYDYGARRYDPAFCMFTQIDPLAEKYPHLNPYVYCAGNPVRYVDPDGMDYWSTNDREQIIAFLNSINIGLSQFDFSGWHHATDAQFTGNLTYNDNTHKYYTSYTDVINGQFTVIGLSFDANITPVSHSGIGYHGAFVYKPLSGFWQKLNHHLHGTKYYDGYFTWNVNEDGRITGMAPLTGTPPLPFLSGKSGMILKEAGKLGRNAKMGRAIGKMSGNRVVQKEQIDALCNKYGIHGAKRQELHRMVSHQGLSYREIEELILDLF